MALLISAIVFGCLTRYLAKNKGYKGGFAWGFFLGIIGLIVVAARRNIDPEPEEMEEVETVSYQQPKNDNTPFVYIDRTVPMHMCPNCQTYQTTKATSCMKCGMRFLDLPNKQSAEQ